MGENIVELTTENFDSTINKGKWVIDFWTSWCAPCKIMAPHFDAAAKDFTGKVHFGKVNLDENYELAERFQIMSVPTTLFMNNRKILYGSVGAINKEQIIKFVHEYFNTGK